METLEKSPDFASLGIPDQQIAEIDAHLEKASRYVFLDTGFNDAFVWLKKSLDSYLEPEHAELLLKVTRENFEPKNVHYLEEGYDSCQSHRELSKIVSESILLGGLAYESKLLGWESSTREAHRQSNSKTSVREELPDLAQIAAKHGGRQDFLFPGVTPTDRNTPSLAAMTYATLCGKPFTSVRTLTGVGGLRSDRDWNHVTDLATFAGLKVEEDKRYYPGLGIFNLLKNQPLSYLPACESLKITNPSLFRLIEQFKETLDGVKTIDFSGVTILCSTFLPAWNDAKAYQAFTTSFQLNLEADFHSPSYEFMILRSIFENKLNVREAENGLNALKFALKKCWSFNSTIHLPWTSELAPLSNNLVGNITNKMGDTAKRYGVGYEGRSLEVIEYNYGKDRTYPYGLAGLTSYVLKTYPESDTFEGPNMSEPLMPSHPVWQEIKQTGFLKVALETLS
jgi:hypothetical protein